MYWQALFVVALAAPVWSHPHHPRHNNNHNKQTCSEQEPTTVTRWTTVTAGVTPTTEATEVAHTTSVAADVDEVEISQATLTTTTTSATSAIPEPIQTSQTSTVVVVPTTLSTALATTSAASKSTVLVTTSAATKSTGTTQATAPAASASGTPGRAIWLWQSDLIQDDAEVVKFLSFAESNAITSVYALIDRDMGDAVFQSFVEQCTSSGIAVEALMGNADWILGAGDPTLESQLEWLENYQGNASTAQRFSAIHMDIEPWGLDDWASNQETYTASLQTIVGQITALGATLGLPVSADLPYWADTVTCPTTGKTLDVWMLENLDTATFMTYRNTAAELLDIATSVLEAGNAAGKPVWLAVETIDAAEAALISYFGKTFSTLSEDLVTIHTSAVTYPSFAGIAIHDYDGALALTS